MKGRPFFKYYLCSFFGLQLVYLFAGAQTLGGNAAYNFLKLSNTPQLSALGGVNVSAITNDAGMAFNNPSLLRASMHQQLQVSFNNMYAGVKNYHSLFALYSNELKTSFSAAVHYIDYGTLPQTDAAGNQLGSFHPRDYTAQVQVSRKYAERWYYGIAVKFIRSDYGIYRSSALAMDAGVAYYDTSRLFQVSLVLKNMGTQLKKYMNTSGDDLPFDVQAGITKKLSGAPVQFSLTAHHLHRLDINYNDSNFNSSNGYGQTSNASTITADKLFRHLVASGQVLISGKIELTLGYNYLLHKELSIVNTANGFTGLSVGVGALFKKIQLRYARSHYQNNTGYNQLGLNLCFLE